MPFFRDANQQQIRQYLECKSTQELLMLNRRIDEFLFKQINLQPIYNQNIEKLEEEITVLKKEIKNIEETNEEIKAYNEILNDNRPSNGAQLHLHLQMYSHTLPTAEKQMQLEHLQKELKGLESQKAWSQREINACKKELTQVNEVKDSKDAMSEHYKTDSSNCRV